MLRNRAARASLVLGPVLTLVVVACARLSGLSELTRDDCALGCDAGDPRDGSAVDVTDAPEVDARDVAAPAHEAGVACGAARCAAPTACCIEADGAAACDDGGGPGACVQRRGFAAQCDDDDDCMALSAAARCCGIVGDLGRRITQTACLASAAACQHALCGNDAGCAGTTVCAAPAPSAPSVCAADGG